MKKVWIDGAGRISIPSPAARLFRPSSPLMRDSIRSATVHRSQAIVPSGRTSAMTPRALSTLGPRTTGSATDSTKLATPESAEEEEHRRSEQDHEHRGKDQEDEREEDLDRRLLSTFLCVLPPPPAHFQCEVPHQRADRDAEGLTLHDRADERSHRRGVDAREHVHQGLVDRQAEALFLERELELFAERTCDPR